MTRDKIDNLAIKIQVMQKQLEEIDAEYKKLLWEQIEPYTHNLNDLRKAVEILNANYFTVSTFDLFSKLNGIKKELSK